MIFGLHNLPPGRDNPSYLGHVRRIGVPTDTMFISVYASIRVMDREYADRFDMKIGDIDVLRWNWEGVNDPWFIVVCPD